MTFRLFLGNKSGQIIAAVKESNWKPMSVFDPSGQPKLYFETRQ
jgi:septal ring factor EnvC (AmiA/AmiB activator)